MELCWEMLMALLFVVLFSVASPKQAQTRNSSLHRWPRYVDNEGKVESFAYEDYYDFSAPSSSHASNTPQKVACYVCMYQVNKDHQQGYPDCADPFISGIVPHVTCDDFCAKVYTKISNEHFMWNRNCMPNCKETDSQTGYTECCKSNLCNGSSTRTMNIFLTLSTIFLTATFYYIFRTWNL